MSSIGMILVVICSLSAASSSFLLRNGIDQVGGFTFDVWAFLRLLKNPYFIVGLIFYGVAGVLWFRVLATEPLSIAYPLLISMTFIVVSCGASVIFREPMSLIKIIGLLVIVTGIYLVGRAGS